MRTIVKLKKVKNTGTGGTFFLITGDAVYTTCRYIDKKNYHLNVPLTSGHYNEILTGFNTDKGKHKKVTFLPTDKIKECLGWVLTKDKLLIVVDNLADLPAVMEKEAEFIPWDKYKEGEWWRQ